MMDHDLLGGLTGAMHLVVATAVTLHVLLTKRDVAATVSWIGIAWLSPIVGSVLYWLIGINRVKRRAFRMRRPRGLRASATDPGSALSEAMRHLEPLQRAAWRISERRAEPGNRIEALGGGDQAYPRMLAAHGGAQRSIERSAYPFRA